MAGPQMMVLITAWYAHPDPLTQFLLCSAAFSIVGILSCIVCCQREREEEEDEKEDEDPEKGKEDPDTDKEEDKAEGCSEGLQRGIFVLCVVFGIVLMIVGMAIDLKGSWPWKLYGMGILNIGVIVMDVEELYHHFYHRTCWGVVFWLCYMAAAIAVAFQFIWLIAGLNPLHSDEASIFSAMFLMAGMMASNFALRMKFTWGQKLVWIGTIGLFVFLLAFEVVEYFDYLGIPEDRWTLWGAGRVSVYMGSFVLYEVFLVIYIVGEVLERTQGCCRCHSKPELEESDLV